MNNDSYKVPSSRGVLIEGRRGKLLGNSYLPGGPGPYPVVVIFHGIPGIERLFDFAVALREAGFATLCFHYSGCWGSDGEYSVLNCMDDCQSVMEYVERNENGDFDLDRVFLLGHSMGGLMAARTASLSSLARAVCIMVPGDFRLAGLEALEGRDGRYKFVIEASSQWVRGLSWESFRAEASSGLEKMDLISYAPALAELPVLTVAAEADALLPKEDHIDRLNAAITACGKGKLTALRYETDHSLNNDRPAIRKAVADFFRSQL